jgi:hypothetical protein
LIHSAADVIAAYLFTTGVVSQPGSVSRPWPLFVNSMPEQPNEAIAIYDNLGDLDGKDMRTGRTLIHPGFLFRIRTNDNRRGERKGGELIVTMDGIYRNVVVVESISYLLQAAKMTTPTIPIGAEEGGSRLLYTVNGTITYGLNP